MSGTTDPHGQPINRHYNAARLSDRAIDELVGLSRGLVADCVVSQEVAEFLARWLARRIEQHLASRAGHPFPHRADRSLLRGPPKNAG